MTTATQNDVPLYCVPAGKIIIVHQRWSFSNGAEECIGLFRAAKDYYPVAEHAEYIKQNPDVNPDPKSWDKDARNAFINWEMNVRKVLEDISPFYLFLEPFPEKPEAQEGQAA